VPLFAAILFSILAAPDTPDDRLNALPFIALVGGAVLLCIWATEKPERVRRLVLAMAKGYALVAVLNVVLIPLVAQGPLLVTSDGSRFQGILENPNTVGIIGFAGVPLLIAAAGFHDSRSPMRRIYGVLAAGLGLEVLASLSRSGIAGTIVAVLLMVAITARHRVVLGLSLAIAAGAALTLVVGFGAVTSLGESLRFGSLSAAGGRVLVAPLVLEEIKRRPVIGHGFGSEPQIIQSFGTVTGALPSGGTGAFTGNYSGNVFLDVGLELGLIGLVCFLVAVFIPVLRLASTIGRHASANQRIVAGVAVGGVAGGLVNAQGESILFSPGSPGALGFWFLVALCTAEGLRAQQRARQPLVL
jgi:O-antigen ligase